MGHRQCRNHRWPRPAHRLPAPCLPEMGANALPGATANTCRTKDDFGTGQKRSQAQSPLKSAVRGTFRLLLSPNCVCNIALAGPSRFRALKFPMIAFGVPSGARPCLAVAATQKCLQETFLLLSVDLDLCLNNVADSPSKFIAVPLQRLYCRHIVCQCWVT